MNKKVLIPVGIGLGAGLLALALISKKSSTPVLVSDAPPPTGGGQTTPTTTINLNKILAKGSTGLEVKELQKLLGFTGLDVDGDFGSQTETRLFYLKGVKSTSLNKYKTLPNVNHNILPIGTKVMANSGVNTPTKLYTALQKADGSFYTNNQVATSVNYGDEVGTIKGIDSTGNWYLVLRSEWTYFPVVYFNDVYRYVKASEVKKI